MVIVKRNLNSQSIEHQVIEGEFDVNDAHNVISLGIDPEGFLHISYDHHGDPLHYRRSLQVMDITGWTEEISMTGVLEDHVTYPYFIMAPEDVSDQNSAGRFYFMYRYWGSGNGDLCLKSYEAKTKTWEDHGPVFIKGRKQMPWTANAYWNHPAFDADGGMVVTWTWRVRGGPEEYINNHNICYARTPDGGNTWVTSRGMPMQSPLTPVTVEVIQAISPASNLINQCSSAMDQEDCLHVVFFADDWEGIPQYYHLWFDGRIWQNDVISARRNNFEFKGGGTLQIPISRPEILIDKENMVYIIYRGDLSGDRMFVQRLKPPYYKAPGDRYVLWDQDLENTEPIIDRIRWRHDGILSMFIQKNHQADHEGLVDVPNEPVWIAD